MSRSIMEGRGRLFVGRPGLRCVGTFVLIVVSCLGCDRMPAGDSAVVELEEGEVRLDSGAQRHDVIVSGVGGPSEFEPATIQASAGDAVVFETADGNTHAIVFRAASLTTAQDSFLAVTGQLRGPPLLSEGARWVVSLQDAPAGDYPFSCASHGGEGRVQVAAPPSNGD